MTIKTSLPRVLIAAPKSGSGKTMISCGLMQVFKENGEDVRAFKCGPDYIDPMFHRRVLGIPSENLDTFFARPEQIRSQLCASCAGEEGPAGSIALIEGVMGIYDGVGGTQLTGSAYDVARITDSPVILVMDVRGMGATMLSLIRGLLADDPDHRIRGVILNRISSGFYERIRPMIEQLGIEPLGFLPVMKGVGLESRHLGLKQPEEIESLNEQLRTIAGALREHVRLDVLRRIMEEAPELEVTGPEALHSDVLYSNPDRTEAGETGKGRTEAEEAGMHEECGHKLTLAVARDPAFTFYYEANLRAFRERGVQIVEFSPLKDACIPKEADALLLGGGYPELYGRELSENSSMRESIREAIGVGMPSLAECGGFMYLHESLTDPDGRSWPMVGVLPGGSANTGKLCRFGYVELGVKTVSEASKACDNGKACDDGKARDDGKACASGTEYGLLRAGETVRAHEFHYYDSDTNGEDCTAVKTGADRTWDCGFLGAEHLWGFPHLYYPSAPQLVDRFIAQMRSFHCRKEA